MTTSLDIHDEAPLPLLLDVKDLVALLRLNEWTVYELLREDKIPGARKIGGSWRVHRDVFLGWMADGGGC
jgi:excisionase family DNA binding protein